MKIAHYPWNVQVLADWLKAEISTGKSLLELANALRISQKILLKWLTLPAPLITLEQIQAIARYQNWDFDGTVQWLGIGLVHLEELREYSKIHSPSNASGDLMLTSTPETGVLDERFWMRESLWEKRLRRSEYLLKLKVYSRYLIPSRPETSRLKFYI